VNSFLQNFNDRLDALDARLFKQLGDAESRLDERLDKLELRLDRLDERIDKSSDQVRQKFGDIDLILSGSGDSVLASLAVGRHEVKSLKHRQGQVSQEFKALEKRLEVLETLRGRTRELQRLAALVRVIGDTPGGLYAWGAIFVGLLLATEAIVIALGLPILVQGILGL
jgi:chromosome segregation ATPase